MGAERLDMIAAMATPAVLLLANGAFIRSTIGRLENILTHVRETELMIVGEDPLARLADLDELHEALVAHARRAKHAHMALLSFYGSGAAFAATVVLIGLAGLQVPGALSITVIAALLGCVLLFSGALLLIREAWIGNRLTAKRFAAVEGRCRELERSIHAGREREEP